MELRVDFGREALIHWEITNCPEKYQICWEQVNQKEQINELQTNDTAQGKYSGITNQYPQLSIKNIDKEDAAYYRCSVKYSSSENELVFTSEKVKLLVINGKFLATCVQNLVS